MPQPTSYPTKYVDPDIPVVTQNPTNQPTNVSREETDTILMHICIYIFYVEYIS